MARHAGGFRWWFAFLLVACTDDTHYRIEMEAGGEEIVRTLSSWVVNEEGGEVAQEPKIDSVDLGGIYGELDELTYNESFRGELPSDFGGAGLYLTWPTKMGTAHLYSERVRGQLDAWAMFAAIEEESDRAADLLLGWMQYEFGDEEWFGELRCRIDEELRRDLKNFALYARMAAAMEGDEAAGITWGFLALQYAVEKGYADPRDLPRYFRLVAEFEESDLEEAVPYAVVHALLSECASTSHPLVTLLSTPKAALDSFQTWYRKYALGEPTSDEEVDADVPLTPFDDYAVLLIQWELFPSIKRLEMELATGGNEPFLTNGEWDEEAGRLRWPEERIEADRIPATYRVALWVAPDVPSQTAHLGRVALTEERLWAYAMWRHGLTAEEEAQWNEALHALAADPRAAEHPEALPFIGEIDARLEAKARELLAHE